MTKYVYFVSYAHKRGWGNIEITQNIEMNDMSAIQGCEKIIAEKGVETPVVASFNLLKVIED